MAVVAIVFRAAIPLSTFISIAVVNVVGSAATSSCVAVLSIVIVTVFVISVPGL
jgi:hypothetical protein